MVSCGKLSWLPETELSVIAWQIHIRIQIQQIWNTKSDYWRKRILAGSVTSLNSLSDKDSVTTSYYMILPYFCVEKG